MAQDNYFVVGDWESAGEKCPINAAGCKDAPWAEELGEDFDSLARDELEGIVNKAIITEEQAKQVWSRLKDKLERSHDWDYDSEQAEMYRQMLELAEMVEDELEW